MPKRKYVVRLTEKEREELRSIVSKGKSSSRTIKRAHVLLRLDSNADVKCDINELHKVLGISRTTVNNILKDYKRRGIECIWRKKRKPPPVKGKITGEVEAHLITLSCHAPPEGYCKWTLRLLSERMVQMNYIDSISHTYKFAKSFPKLSVFVFQLLDAFKQSCTFCYEFLIPL